MGVGLQDLLPPFYMHRHYGGRSLPYDYEKRESWRSCWKSYFGKPSVKLRDPLGSFSPGNDPPKNDIFSFSFFLMWILCPCKNSGPHPTSFQFLTEVGWHRFYICPLNLKTLATPMSTYNMYNHRLLYNWTVHEPTYRRKALHNGPKIRIFVKLIPQHLLDISTCGFHCWIDLFISHRIRWYGTFWWGVKTACCTCFARLVREDLRAVAYTKGTTQYRACKKAKINVGFFEIFPWTSSILILNHCIELVLRCTFFW